MVNNGESMDNNGESMGNNGESMDNISIYLGKFHHLTVLHWE